MALSIYTSAVKEFETALYEIERYLDFIKSANVLRPWIGELVNWETLNQKEQQHKKNGVQSFIGQKEYNIEIGYNGLIVSIGAAFESLIRRILNEGVKWINGKIKHYTKLSVALRQQNLIRSGHALITVAEPPVEISYDYELLCKQLGTCWTNGGDLLLNSDAFSASVTNINQRRIDDSLLRIGIKIDWDFFGKKEPLCQHFKTKPGRNTTDEVVAYLKKFVIDRNKIAHSGLSIRILESDVSTAMSFFKGFAPLLAEAVELELKSNRIR